MLNRDPDVTIAFSAGLIFSTAPNSVWIARPLQAPSSARAAELLFTPNLSDYCYDLVTEQAKVIDEWHNGSLSPLGFSSLVVLANPFEGSPRRLPVEPYDSTS